jgi:hypothetical protein
MVRKRKHRVGKYGEGSFCAAVYTYTSYTSAPHIPVPTVTLSPAHPFFSALKYPAHYMHLV